MSRVPPSATPDIKASLTEVWQAIDALRTQQTLNLDLHGKRIINAGDAVQETDYVTKGQLDDVAAAAPTPSTDGLFHTLTVDGLARFLGGVKLPHMTDGTGHLVILFVDATGALAGQSGGGGNFTFNPSAGLLELGYALRIAWIDALASIGPGATDGILNVVDHLGTGFVRFVLGPDDATGIALTKNGTTLEIRVAGAGGALTAISASNIGGGSAGVFATLVVGTDPGGADIARIGGSLTVVTVHASGAVIIGTDPGGAEPLRVNGGIMQKDPAGIALHSASTLANGAGGSIGTLNNAPSAGDPTKWIEIDDAGVTRRLPSW